MEENEEKFTLKEVNELFMKMIPRYEDTINNDRKNDNSGFIMGEKNMSSIINSFLINGGSVVYFGNNNEIKQITPATRSMLI